MSNTQLELIENAFLYYKRGDFSLGYRSLLDAALNTNSASVFKKVLNFVEIYENTEESNKASLLNNFEDCKEEIIKEGVSSQGLYGKTILKGKELTKSYNKGRFVLGPIDIELKKGDIFGLVGENGNGKTTLLTILGSLIALTSGKLNYSFSSENNDDYDLSSKLVYIPQRTPVWYGRVLDNLKFALVHHGVKGEMNELFVLMMVARFGLWKYKGLKWSELSSGYKMRFELARTMLRRPEIILLDEPLANLDILAQQIILEDLKMMAKSPVNPIAMIFSSQQLYEVEKISDAVIYLRNGKPSEYLQLEEKEEHHLIIELDTESTREELETVFENKLEKLEYNGGVYVLYFTADLSFNELLILLANNDIKVQYLRDISKSTRRFFVY